VSTGRCPAFDGRSSRQSLHSEVAQAEQLKPRAVSAEEEGVVLAASAETTMAEPTQEPVQARHRLQQSFSCFFQEDRSRTGMAPVVECRRGEDVRGSQQEIVFF